jgi:hypothetical protein
MAVSRKSSKASRSHSRKSSKKASRAHSRKASHKVSRKVSHKASRKVSRKMSKKGSQAKKSSCGAGSKRVRVPSYKRAGKTVKGHFRCVKRQ